MTTSASLTLRLALASSGLLRHGERFTDRCLFAEGRASGGRVNRDEVGRDPLSHPLSIGRTVALDVRGLLDRADTQQPEAGHQPEQHERDLDRRRGGGLGQ